MFKFCLIFSLTIITAKTNYACSNSSPSPPNYYLVEKCYRSKLGIVVKANYSSLSSCQKFGIANRGLAINFSPPEAWNDRNSTLEYNCEVLKCAEANGGHSLVNDSRYDYHSLYAKPLPHLNATCVPAIGMYFLITKKQNYTDAIQQCRNMTAVPADVNSEQRTDALAQVLAGANIDAAFVGLRSKNGSAFIDVHGDSLDCITYRAWAPGHPGRHRNKLDCVLLTRYRTWQSTPCKKSHPTLCELIPGGPYKRGSIFASRNQNVTIEQPLDD